MEFFYPVVKFFTAGGAFMFPILLVGAISAAIAIERYITLTKMGARNRSTWARVEPTLASADFEKARELTSKDESPIARVSSRSAPTTSRRGPMSQPCSACWAR